MKYIALFSCIIFFNLSSHAQFNKILDKAKKVVSSDNSSNVGMGLKEALNEGIKEAVDQLSKDNGYLDSPYKILIPEDAQKVINKVSKVPGFEDVETKLIQQMNKSAELAAKKATPIFVDAIKAMTFKDALAILNGKNDAATTYLEGTSRNTLYNDFAPVIKSTLDEINANAYWSSVVATYNKIPLVKKMNPDLNDHVTQKALDGLFGLIAVKELGIRTDVKQRTSPLLLEVFGRN